jgi:hypothetical protein
MTSPSVIKSSDEWRNTDLAESHFKYDLHIDEINTYTLTYLP